MAESVDPKVLEALRQLTPQEQELLVRILRIERDKLYQERPRVKEDLVRAVREVFK